MKLKLKETVPYKVGFADGYARAIALLFKEAKDQERFIMQALGTKEGPESGSRLFGAALCEAIEFLRAERDLGKAQP